MFAGTPDFAVPALRGLVAGGHKVALAVTQPDRPKGRGLKLVPPPVKVAASAFGIPVWQPEAPTGQELLSALRDHQANALVVVAYAHKIPPEVLDAPRHGCINLHASLLPRWRGAAPIAWAILEGDRITGVTTMRMDEGWDTGPILLQSALTIGEDDTAASLHDRLSVLGADLLASTLDRLEAGTIEPVAQSPQGVRLAPRLSREMGRIPWDEPASHIARRCRAFHPWPGCFTTAVGRTIKVSAVEVVASGEWCGDPGEVVDVDRGGGSLTVACGSGSFLRLLQVQPEGSRMMSAFEMANGLRIGRGFRFDP